MDTADAEPDLEALQDRLRTALRDPLEEQWNDVFGQWTDASPAERAAVRTEVSDLRDRLLEELLDLGSVERLHRALALQYVAVKGRWMTLTTRLQDQASRTGDPDRALLYRTASVGLLLQALDPLLDGEHLADLGDVLAEPLQ